MSSAQGTAVLDFGAFPGTDRASIAVTGQASILGTSLVEPWIIPEATAIHSEDEVAMLKHFVEVSAPTSTIIAGTGFTIVGTCHDEFMWGTFKIGWAWSD
jgi:hypothetical protein